MKWGQYLWKRAFICCFPGPTSSLLKQPFISWGREGHGAQLMNKLSIPISTWEQMSSDSTNFHVSLHCMSTSLFSQLRDAPLLKISLIEATITNSLDLPNHNAIWWWVWDWTDKVCNSIPRWQPKFFHHTD